MSDVSGFDLVSALADVHDAMKDLAFALERDPSWRDLQTRVTVNRYLEDKLFIECYVDGERSDGRGFAWWLEAQWSMGKWNIEGSLLESGPSGQDAVETIGPVTAATAAELAQGLRRTVTSLMQCLPPPPSGASEAPDLPRTA